MATPTGEDRPPARGRRPRAGQAVLDKAFTLLRAFDAEHPAHSLASLASRCGLPRSTAQRLARKLSDIGALERLDDGRYAVGLGLLEIAALAPGGHNLHAVAMPVMEDLLRATRHHVALAVRDGQQALEIHQLSAPEAAASASASRSGGRTSLPATAAGLVLLAYAPADVQQRALEEHGPHGETVGASPDLRRRLAEIRRTGYATRTEHGGPGPISTAAAPVRGAGGEVVAAVAADAPSAEFTVAHIQAVRAGARAVSRRLGRG